MFPGFFYFYSLESISIFLQSLGQPRETKPTFGMEAILKYPLKALTAEDAEGAEGTKPRQIYIAFPLRPPRPLR